MDRPIRLGLLAAARITKMAVVDPAALVDGVELTAVAARDLERARTSADEWGVPIAYGSYDELVTSDAVDAVYVATPASLHRHWTIAALEAGKDVLCEKPLAANADEAREMVSAAERSGQLLVEAFHWRYHPLARRMREIVDSGVLGPIRRIETRMCIPLPRPRDIRWRLDLAGGAVMDVGCYAIHQLRFLAGAEPEVVSARARLASPGVDRWTQADLSFPDGRTGQITCALWSSTVLRLDARVLGERGELRVLNPTGPQWYHRITLRTPEGVTRERVPGGPTYRYQLEAFVAAVRDGAPIPTGPSDSIANMRVVDAVYRAAGLGPRHPTRA